jgi:hypothetical protein
MTREQFIQLLWEPNVIHLNLFIEYAKDKAGVTLPQDVNNFIVNAITHPIMPFHQNVMNVYEEILTYYETKFEIKILYNNNNQIIKIY